MKPDNMSKRAIVIISAGIKKNKNGAWSNSDLTKQDNRLGAPGGSLRVIAAVYLYRDKPDYFLIIAGGRGYDVKDKSSNRPDLCQITRDELKKFGLPVNKIITENKSNTTSEQLQELKKIILKLRLESVIIISNKYHLPRVKAMINKDAALKVFMANGKIKLASAEQILLKQNSKKWCWTIKKAYESDWMKIRIKKEKQGIKDLKNNKYKF